MVSMWMRGFKSMDPLELGCPAQNLPKSGQGSVSGIPVVVQKTPAEQPQVA
jgi:hypothetical protein